MTPSDDERPAAEPDRPPWPEPPVGPPARTRTPPARRRLASVAVVALLVTGAAGAALVADRQEPRAPLRASPTAGSTTAGLTTAGSTTATTASGSGFAAPARPTADEDEARTRALVALLDRRRTAVLTHDPAAWLSTVDPRATAFRAAQATVFANLRDVPFADWRYELGGAAPALTQRRQRELGGQAWVARVLAGHRITGYDRAASFTEQYLTVVRRPSGWLLAADTDGATARQPWDLGTVAVVRGERVLVLGTASAATLRTYARAGDRAIGRVTAVWGGDWPRRALLVAPRTQAEFGKLLLREPSGLGQIAAVTTGDLGGGRVERPGTSRNDRVVINPAAFARLGPIGRRVVLTHEMTHVAVRASTSAPVPIWLSEGLADYIGYRGTGITRRAAAADVLALVRQGHGPEHLPTAGDFDPTRTTIAPSYSGAWLACARLADEYGERRLVRLYRAAATAPADPDRTPDPQAELARAFPRVLGVSQRRFTADWRDYLQSLAG